MLTIPILSDILSCDNNLGLEPPVTVSEHRVLAHVMPQLTPLLESIHRLTDHTDCSKSMFGVMFGRHTLSNNYAPRLSMLRNSSCLRANHPPQMLIDPAAGVHVLSVAIAVAHERKGTDFRTMKGRPCNNKITRKFLSADPCQ
eukprot:3059118-Amphidinium_carterae.1